MRQAVKGLKYLGIALIVLSLAIEFPTLQNFFFFDLDTFNPAVVTVVQFGLILIFLYFLFKPLVTALEEI